MNKCCASQDGICRNSILFGTKCDGYKERCTFYEHCPECFMSCPGDQGEIIRKLQSNE